MKIAYYNVTRALIDELEAPENEVFVQVNIGARGYAGTHEVPFSDFCELVRAHIDKSTSNGKTKAGVKT